MGKNSETESSKLTKQIKLIVLIVSILGGSGASYKFGIPFFQKQLDRIDVIIYLFCDLDQGCVVSAWKHIDDQKHLQEIKSGGR